MENVMGIVRIKSQEIIDKVLAALNPISGADLPIAAHAVKEILKVIEKQLDPEQKVVYETLSLVLGSKEVVIKVPKEIISEEEEEERQVDAV